MTYRTGILLLLALSGCVFLRRTMKGENGQYIDARVFGAKFDGASDDTRALRKGIFAAAASGRPLRLPSGIAVITPMLIGHDESGIVRYAFPLLSNLAIISSGKTIIKLKDNQSSDEHPTNIAFFFTNGFVENITFRNITFDGNGAENRISPRRPNSYNRFNQAMISVSGARGHEAAHANNVCIRDCNFENSAGSCCIVAGQSAEPGAILGSHWRFENLVFRNNGLDTDDHSSIYAWIEDAVCSDCIFEADTMPSGKSGATVAYEIHGARQRFTGNVIRNYYRGIWVSGNLTKPTDRIQIDHNTFHTMFYGVDFYRESGDALSIGDVVISSNGFFFDSAQSRGSPLQKAAVQISARYAIRDVRILHNRGTMSGRNVASAFIVITSRDIVSQWPSNVRCEENDARGFSAGVLIRSAAHTPIGFVSIRKNIFEDLVAAGISSTSVGVSVLIYSTMQRLLISENVFRNTRGTAQLDFGIYIHGNVLSSNLSDESCSNVRVPLREN